ncbi:uncharacterized protein DS421_5g145540 [Arachis hypogaea]|nr:uncharacterized protein DS421_5g145540 [Arachis hypogaea]
MWVCSAVYTHPQAHRRYALWDYLDKLKVEIRIPWLMLGDFNEVLVASEIRSRAFNSSKVEFFAAAMDECGLMDLGSSRKRFSWFRRVRGDLDVAEKLDRAFVN